MYKAKVAETEAEVNSAYELFYRSFGPYNYEAKDIFDISRENDPTMKPENLFIMEDEGKSIYEIVKKKMDDLILTPPRAMRGSRHAPP